MKRKSKELDPDEKWKTTYNHYVNAIKFLYRWIYNQQGRDELSEPATWETPSFVRLRHLKIDLRNVSREVTTEGREVKKHVNRAKVKYRDGTTGNGNKIYLSSEGHRWFEENRLPIIKAKA